MSADVAAVILTCDARGSLERLLGALASQTVPLAAIQVTDNASTEPVDDLAAAVPGTSVTRLGVNKACVAVANKMARVAWALLHTGAQYRKPAVVSI